MLGHLLDAVECLVDLLVAFEAEGNGDDAHGEDVHLTGALGDDGCRSGAGTTSHAGSDECHTGAVGEELLDLFDGLEGCLTAFLGLVARTKAFAHLEFVGHRRIGQRLAVGVAEDVGHVVDAFVVHVGDGIAAAATDAHNLDDTGVTGLEVELDASGFAIIVVHIQQLTVKS